MHGIMLDGAEHPVWLARSDSGYVLHHAGGACRVSLDGADLIVDGTRIPLLIAVDGDRVFVHLGGAAHEAVLLDPVARHAAATGPGGDVLLAPMPGVVNAVLVAVGDSVQAGDTLLVIESMKLEMAIKAPRDGMVAALLVPQGGTFDRDAPLAALAPGDAG